MRRKNCTIAIRCSKGQKTALEYGARKEGVTLSRFLLMAGIRKSKEIYETEKRGRDERT